MLKAAVVTLLGGILLVGISAGSASAEDLFKSRVEGIQVTGQLIAGIAGGGPPGMLQKAEPRSGLTGI